MATTTMGMHHHGEKGSAAKVGYFLWHLLQMVLAMFVGMVFYGVLLDVVLAPAGYAAALVKYQLVDYSLLSVFMTAPMIALMRYQGHSWQGSAEMAVAMIIPTIALAALVQFGSTAYVPWLSVKTLHGSTHAAMLLAMVGLMLYRRADYV